MIFKVFFSFSTFFKNEIVSFKYLVYILKVVDWLILYDEYFNIFKLSQEEFGIDFVVFRMLLMVFKFFKFI